jgi:arabinose-5-phosphate isomerase
MPKLEANRNLVVLSARAEPADEVLSEEALVEDARAVFKRQAMAVAALADKLDESFPKVVSTILSTPGHVVLFAMGKSGLVARKLAATFASTGTPSFFVHPAEAQHGDLGKVTERDTAILVSCSGDTREVLELIPHLRRLGIPIIGMTGNPRSKLAAEADLILDVGVDREACPHNLAPTNSTLATMAMGDALAVSLIRMRDFGPSDFARFHPGGSLGRRLTTRVKDAMRSTDLPIVGPGATVGESLVKITEGRLGLALIMAGERLIGLVTDGDLRRAMQRHPDLLSMPVSDIMTDNPVTIADDAMLEVARQRMQQLKLKALVAVNSRGRVTGIVEVFDDN